jgi:Bacterial transglutaminase-like cysteine proteinase BTLCP
VTRPPAGWVDFCARQPGECTSTVTAPHELTLSPEAWKDLVRVNNWVNQTIRLLGRRIVAWGAGYGDIEQILAPTLKPGHIVILNDFASHKVAGVREPIEVRGASLVYLPP